MQTASFLQQNGADNTGACCGPLRFSRGSRMWPSSKGWTGTGWQSDPQWESVRKPSPVLPGSIIRCLTLGRNHCLISSCQDGGKDTSQDPPSREVHMKWLWTMQTTIQMPHPVGESPIPQVPLFNKDQSLSSSLGEEGLFKSHMNTEPQLYGCRLWGSEANTTRAYFWRNPWGAIRPKPVERPWYCTGGNGRTWDWERGGASCSSCLLCYE